MIFTTEYEISNRQFEYLMFLFDNIFSVDIDRPFPNLIQSFPNRSVIVRWNYYLK